MEILTKIKWKLINTKDKIKFFIINSWKYHELLTANYDWDFDWFIRDSQLLFLEKNLPKWQEFLDNKGGKYGYPETLPRNIKELKVVKRILTRQQSDYDFMFKNHKKKYGELQMTIEKDNPVKAPNGEDAYKMNFWYEYAESQEEARDAKMEIYKTIDKMRKRDNNILMKLYKNNEKWRA